MTSQSGSNDSISLDIANTMTSTSHKRKRSDTIDDLEVDLDDDDGIVLIISEDEVREYLHILDDTIELSNGDKYDGELCKI